MYSGWDICVFYNGVSLVISSGGSVHFSTHHVQVAALAGDKISVIS